MNFTPLDDYVLVERDEAEEKIGSIFIPGSAQKSLYKGEVVAVGAGKWTDDGERQIGLTVEPGNRVMFGSAAQTLKVDGKDMLIMRESNIFGVVA